MGCYHWATVKHPHVTYHRSNYNPSYLLCPIFCLLSPLFYLLSPVSSSTGLACSLPLFHPLLRSSRHGHGIIPSLVVSAVNARIPWRLCLNHHGDHLAVVKDDYVELWCTCGEKDFLVAAGNCASEWILTVCCVHLVLVSMECRAVLLVPALAIALIVHLCSLYSPLHLTFFSLPTPLLLPAPPLLLPPFPSCQGPQPPMAVSVLVLSGHVAGCGEQVSELHPQTCMYTHQANTSPSSCHIHTPTCTPPFQLVTFPPTLTTLTILSFPPSLLPQYLPSHIQYSHNTLTTILTTLAVPSLPPSLLPQYPHSYPHYSHNTPSPPHYFPVFPAMVNSLWLGRTVLSLAG